MGKGRQKMGQKRNLEVILESLYTIKVSVNVTFSFESCNFMEVLLGFMRGLYGVSIASLCCNRHYEWIFCIATE